MNEEEYDDQINALAEVFYETDDAKSQLAALEPMIRLADSAGDLHGGFNFRMELIQIAVFSGQEAKALVAFTWCLAQFDKQPEEFDSHDILWKYKWILENLPTFLSVKKEKIFELQDDMEKRLFDAGFNLRPIHYLRWTNAMRMGDFERAQKFLQKWEDTPRDSMADCKACEQNKLSELYGRIGEYQKSTEAAEVILDGRMTCAEIPHLTYGHLVPTYLKLGRVDELKDQFQKWYKLIHDNEDFLGEVSQFIRLTAGLGLFPESLAMFEKHARWAVTTPSDHNRFIFFNASAFLFEQLVVSESEVRLSMPEGFKCFRSDAKYQTMELGAWFQTEAQLLANQFNERNGNDYFTHLINESANLF